MHDKRRDKSGHYIIADKMPTSSFVPQLNKLFLAAPARGTHPAEIRVYIAQAR